MSDLISRQAALAAISDDKGIQYPGWWYKDRIRTVPGVQGWIPVSERLPEGDCECIVTAKNKHVDGYPDNEVCIADFYKGEFAPSQAWWGIERILAWMPLPDPWKGDV